MVGQSKPCKTINLVVAAGHLPFSTFILPFLAKTWHSGNMQEISQDQFQFIYLFFSCSKGFAPRLISWTQIHSELAVRMKFSSFVNVLVWVCIRPYLLRINLISISIYDHTKLFYFKTDRKCWIFIMKIN